MTTQPPDTPSGPGGAQGPPPPEYSPTGYPTPGGYITPPPGVYPVASPDPLGIAAICCGVVSLVLGCPCGVAGIAVGVAAVVLGIVSLTRLGRQPDRFSQGTKPLAIVGIVLGGLSLVLGTVMVVIGNAFSFLSRFQH